MRGTRHRVSDRSGTSLKIPASAAIFFNLFVASILAVVLWHICPAWILFLWLALFCIIVGARFVDQRRYLREPSVNKPAEHWRRRYAFGCASTGALWGGIAVTVDLITSDPIYLVQASSVISRLLTSPSWADLTKIRSEGENQSQVQFLYERLPAPNPTSRIRGVRQS